MMLSVEILSLPSSIVEDCAIPVAVGVIRTREVLIPGRYLQRVFGIGYSQSGVGYWDRVAALERKIEEIFAGQTNFG